MIIDCCLVYFGLDGLLVGLDLGVGLGCDLYLLGV